MGIVDYNQILLWLYLALTVGLAFGFFVRRIRKLVKPAVFLVLGLEIIKAILISSNIYFSWQNNPLSKFLLPPHQDISYFFGYVGYRFFFSLLLSVVVGLIFFYLAKWINNKKDQGFFRSDEPRLLLFGILVVGHPLWLIYLGSILVLAIIISLIRYFSKADRVLSLYYFWLPIALIILILSNWIIKWAPLATLKF